MVVETILRVQTRPKLDNKIMTLQSRWGAQKKGWGRTYSVTKQTDIHTRGKGGAPTMSRTNKIGANG